MKRTLRIPFFSLCVHVWKYAIPKQKLQLSILYLVFFLENVVSCIPPILLGWFMNEMQTASNIVRAAWIYALAYLGQILLDWSVYGPARVKERQLAFRISQNFLSHLLDRMFHRDVDWHKNNHSGAINNRLRKAYAGLREFADNGSVYFRRIFQLSVSIVAMIYFSPLFGIVAVLIGFIALYVNNLFDKPYIKTLNKYNETEHKFMADLTDGVANIITVITLRLQKAIHGQLVSRASEMFGSYQLYVRINELRWFVVTFLVAFIYTLSLIGYVYDNYVPGTVFYVGSLVTLLSFVNRFTDTFYSMTMYYADIIRNHTDIQSAASIEETDGTTVNSSLLQAEKVYNWKYLKISELSFIYRQKPTDANNGSHRSKGLMDVDISIERGKRIALIGESGSGKSTFLSLMRGLYTPDHFNLEMDHQKVIDWNTLSDTTTLFPQEPEIFESSVLYNITMGLPFDEVEITRACNLACISEMINQMPEGMETVVAEKGANLSGGQKQRLAIARGILAAKNISFVLLDEPTSHLDFATEREIYDNLFNVFSDKTVICVIHNLNLLHRFDYIFQFDNGRIISEGVPEKFFTLHQHIVK